MTTAAVLAVDEVELRLFRPGEAPRRSRVYATIDGETPCFDRDPFAADPRLACDTYVRALETRPLGLRGLAHASAADLLHEHVRAFAADERVPLLLVSPVLSEETLALLLGVLVRVGIRPPAIVDAAVAAGACALSPGESGLYIEMARGRTLLVPVTHANGRIARGEPATIDGIGGGVAFTAFQRWVREHAIAAWRRDPLSEPAARARLAAQWEALRVAFDGSPAGGEAEGTLDFDGGRTLAWRASALRAPLEALARPVVDALLASPAPTVALLAPNVAEEGALGGALARARSARLLAAEALATAARTLGREIQPGPDGTIAHLVDVPAPEGLVPAATTYRGLARAVGPRLELLLVADGRAQRLPRDRRVTLPGQHVAAGQTPLELEARDDHVLLHGEHPPGLRLNGRAVASGQHAAVVLRAGDRLDAPRLGGIAIVELVDGV